MADAVKVTIQVARVLKALLEDPRGLHYGLHLMQAAKLASGSLYPIMRRLEAAGWVTSTWEDTSREEAGRNRRRYYQLTGEGVQLARQELASLSAELAMPLRGPRGSRAVTT